MVRRFLKSSDKKLLAVTEMTKKEFYQFPDRDKFVECSFMFTSVNSFHEQH